MEISGFNIGDFLGIRSKASNRQEPSIAERLLAKKLARWLKINPLLVVRVLMEDDGLVRGVGGAVVGTGQSVQHEVYAVASVAELIGSRGPEVAASLEDDGDAWRSIEPRIAAALEKGMGPGVKLGPVKWEGDDGAWFGVVTVEAGCLWGAAGPENFNHAAKMAVVDAMEAASGRLGLICENAEKMDSHTSRQLFDLSPAPASLRLSSLILSSGLAHFMAKMCEDQCLGDALKPGESGPRRLTSI